MPVFTQTPSEMLSVSWLLMHAVLFRHCEGACWEMGHLFFSECEVSLLILGVETLVALVCTPAG